MYIIKCICQKIDAQKGAFMDLLQNRFKHWQALEQSKNWELLLLNIS